MLTAARRLLAILLVALGAAAVVVGLGARLAPLADLELHAVRSGSMAPAIGIGDLVVVDTGTRPDVGQVAAVRLGNGVTVLHRVTRIVERSDGTWIETRGDANAVPDPVLSPMTSVAGVAPTRVPLVGFFLAMLSLPLGIVSLLGFAGAVVATIALLDELSTPVPPIEGERTPVLSSTPTR